MACRKAGSRRGGGLLRKGGFLNPKYPGGTEVQQALLEAEGVRVSPLRKQPAVFDFAERKPIDPLEAREPERSL